MLSEDSPICLSRTNCVKAQQRWVFCFQDVAPVSRELTSKVMTDRNGEGALPRLVPQAVLTAYHVTRNVRRSRTKLRHRRPGDLAAERKLSSGCMQDLYARPAIPRR